MVERGASARSRLGCLLLFLALGASGEREWVDLDTPESAHTISIRGEKHVLVFSDEFEADGRTFSDGHDPVWTGLDSPVYSNAQVNGYNSSLAYTRGGKLVLRSLSRPWVWAQNPDVTAPFQTAMLQTWNKMCFTGGFIELRAQMPGSSEQPGLWPAFWMMGNLGRATFKASTERMWPFNYDQCPSEDDTRANQYYDIQELSKCKLGMGRGSPEIDIVETMPGAFVYDYADKIDKGICPPADAEELRRTATKQPFVCTSVQAAPGQPADALQRPTLGCLPQAGEYYPTLHPRDANYDPVVGPYGTAYNVSLNYEFYGDLYTNYGLDGNSLHTDAFSACTMLEPTHFDTQHRWQTEWRARGDDGDFVRFTLDDELQFHVAGALLSDERKISFADGEGGGTMLGRKIPDEPMYLILNVDLSPRWGFPYCDPGRCDCCFDCGKADCLTCLEDVNGTVVDTRQWLSALCDSLPQDYEIDYVRVYQREGEENIGCDPLPRPTAEFIRAHEERYTPSGSDEALKPVASGGAACGAGARDGVCGVEGACEQGVCVCAAGWTGPRCLVRAVGTTRLCEPLRPLSSVNVPGRWSADSCLALDNLTHAELLEAAELQCTRVSNATVDGWANTSSAANDSVAIARQACAEIAPGARYGACGARARANHVLSAYAESTGGMLCCNTLAASGRCGLRLGPLMAGLAGGCLLIVVCASLACKYRQRLRKLCAPAYTRLRRLRAPARRPTLKAVRPPMAAAPARADELDKVPEPTPPAGPPEAEAESPRPPPQRAAVLTKFSAFVFDLFEAPGPPFSLQQQLRRMSNNGRRVSMPTLMVTGVEEADETASDTSPASSLPHKQDDSREHAEFAC